MTVTCTEEARKALASRKAVAEYIDKPAQTLAIWATQGRGPKFFKLENGSVRYRWSDVDAWLDAQATGGSPVNA